MEPSEVPGGSKSLCVQRVLLGRRDHRYLADAALPAHPLQAGGRQDDGGVVLPVVQLLQPSVEVPSLQRGGAAR